MSLPLLVILHWRPLSIPYLFALQPLARLGAKVTGLDAVEENVIAANAHANMDKNVARNVEYICSTVEDLVGECRESFDAVVASEVIEHVNDQVHFVRSCSELVKVQFIFPLLFRLREFIMYRLMKKKNMVFEKYISRNIKAFILKIS